MAEEEARVDERQGEGLKAFATDELAYASPMRNWPPLGKFLLVLSLLIVSLASSSIIVPATVACVGFALLFYSTRFRFPRVIGLAVVDALLIFLLSSFIIAIVTAGNSVLLLDLYLFKLNFTDAGIQLAVLVFTRALAGVMVMLFFATSTPIPHFALALRQIRVPREITELIILVYRYSFLLLEQLETMYTAAQCREGFRGIRNTLRTTSKLAAGLFILSLEVGDRSQIALYCRNFKGDFPAFRPPARMTVVWALMPFVAFALLYLLNLALTNPHTLGW